MSPSRIERWALRGADALALLPSAGGAWARIGARRVKLAWDWRRDRGGTLARALGRAWGPALRRVAAVAVALPDAWLEPGFDGLAPGAERRAFEGSGLAEGLAQAGLAADRLCFRSLLAGAPDAGELRVHAHADGVSLLHGGRGRPGLFRERAWKGKPAWTAALRALLADSRAWCEQHPQWQVRGLRVSGLDALAAQARALKLSAGLEPGGLDGLFSAARMLDRELAALEAL